MANKIAFIKIISWLRGDLVGIDQWGNSYYQTRPFKGIVSWLRGIRKGQKQHRWVCYRGIVEATKVPPQWHGWLHYTIDTPPLQNDKHYSWQKDAQPNLTGTPLAHKPGIDPNDDNKKYRDYQPWKPK